ncbi:hypothetical protein PybrP1_007953 [[Pythium] brassicae (nom. inval.)]|nr:hypothetical protein PybrP1_007953 [[Pythium] brassicae (nom. inval.)]
MPSRWTQELRWMRCNVARGDHEMRLDRWLRQQFPSAPQSLLQAQLRKRKIRVAANHNVLTISAQDEPVGGLLELQPAKAGAVLREGFTVAIDAHLFRNTLQALAPAAMSAERAAHPTHRGPLLPELLSRVVHADANFLVLDKPHGLAVQEPLPNGCSGHAVKDGTGLATSLADYLPAIAQAFADATPASGGATERSDEAAEPCRLVHRLDKETSGLLVLARSRLAAAKFAALLQTGQVRKTYHALVAAPTALQRQALETALALAGGAITAPVDGKPATTLVGVATHSRPDRRGVWLELSPVTGRKHQLRVHCAQVLGAAIVGDRKYGGPRAERLFLHAHRIAFPDPFHGKEEGDERGDGRQQVQSTSDIAVERPIDYVYWSEAGHAPPHIASERV